MCGRRSRAFLLNSEITTATAPEQVVDIAQA